MTFDDIAQVAQETESIKARSNGRRWKYDNPLISKSCQMLCYSVISRNETTKSRNNWFLLSLEVYKVDWERKGNKEETSEKSSSRTIRTTALARRLTAYMGFLSRLANGLFVTRRANQIFIRIKSLQIKFLKFFIEKINSLKFQNIIQNYKLRQNLFLVSWDELSLVSRSCFCNATWTRRCHSLSAPKLPIS